MNRTIGDIMERDAYTCRYDQNLGEVVTLFNELGTSGLVVIDEDRHVVGFISDGDIMKAVAAQKTRSIFSGGYSNMVLYDSESFEEKARALKRRNVMELAVQRVLCATADQTIGEIADVLAKKKFKKVPVIDEDGRLIGMVRRATITRYLFDVLFGEEEPSQRFPGLVDDAGGVQGGRMGSTARVARCLQRIQHRLPHFRGLVQGGCGVIKVDHGLTTFPAFSIFSAMTYIFVTLPT